MRSLLIALCLLLALAFVTAEEAESFEVDETEEFEEAAQAEEVEEDEEDEDVLEVQATRSRSRKPAARKSPSKKPKVSASRKPKVSASRKPVSKSMVKPMMSPMATTMKVCYRKPYNGTFKKLNPPANLAVNVTYRHFTKIQWTKPVDAPKNSSFLIRYWGLNTPVLMRGMRQRIKTKPGDTFYRINRLLRPGTYRVRISTVSKCFTKSDWAVVEFNITTRRQQLQALRNRPASPPPRLPTPPPSRSRV